MKRTFVPVLLTGLPLLLLLLVFSAGAGGAPAKQAKPVKPRTLVVANSPIYAFAQDDDAIAWIDAKARVRVRLFSKQKTSVVGRVDPVQGAPGSVLALTGKRALWAWDSGGDNSETSIKVGSPGTPPAAVDDLAGGFRGFGDGERFSGIAGAGGSLAYGWVSAQCMGVPYGICDFCDPPGSCGLSVSGGGVALVPAEPTGRRPPVIPGLPTPALFALSSGFVAVAPARSPTPEGEWVPRVADDGPVEVHDLSGRLTARIQLIGMVRDLALSAHMLAVLLERPDASKVIERFDANNGMGVADWAFVPPGASDLSAGPAGTIFRVGRDIYRLGPGPRPKFVARAGATPIGLSIAGRRIAWAVNLKGRGRIVALMLR
jgi:hypothetical protein